MRTEHMPSGNGHDRHPLLTLEQEIALGKRMEAGRIAKEQLVAGQINEDFTHLEQLVADGREAWEMMFFANKGLVKAIAFRFDTPAIPFSDLVQEGNIGLMIAINKYDYRRGNKFSTYATWWIKEAISNAIDKENPGGIKHTKDYRDALDKFHYLTEVLTQELGRYPEEGEIAARTGFTVDEIRDFSLASLHPISLDKEMFEWDKERIESIEDPTAISPDEAIEDGVLRKALETALQNEHPRDRRVIELRYGFTDGEFHTLGEVGALFGLSPEGVRQIERRVFIHLRQPRVRKFIEGSLESL